MRYVVILFLLFNLMGCGTEEKLSVVEGNVISSREFDAYLKYKRIQAGSDERRQALLKKYVEREALAAAIEKSELLDRGAIEAEINEFRKEILISRYFDQFVKTRLSEEALRKKANAIRDQIKGSKPFAELAKAGSQDKATAHKKGDLGWIQKGAMGQKFSHAAFSLKAGEVSEPVETAFGYHLITVHEAPRSVKRPLKSVAGTIRNRIKREATAKEMERLMASVRVKMK
ncbi:MAG: peptidylprolyl isomerase [Desulfobacteraceae bacterium]